MHFYMPGQGSLTGQLFIAYFADEIIGNGIAIGHVDVSFSGGKFVLIMAYRRRY